MLTQPHQLVTVCSHAALLLLKLTLAAAAQKAIDTLYTCQLSTSVSIWYYN
jgi:hypothetical protein